MGTVMNISNVNKTGFQLFKAGFWDAFDEKLPHPALISIGDYVRGYGFGAKLFNE